MNRNTQVKTVDSFKQNAKVCGYCGIKGHKINAYHCHKRKNLNNIFVGFVKSQLSDCNESLKQNNPFLFPITFIGSDSETTLTCFRDNGFSMTLLKQNVIADEYLTFTNEFVNLKFIKGGIKNVPVFIATVSADLVDGDIKVAVVPDDAEFLEGADFLLGTDVLPLSVQNSKMVAVTTRKQAKLLAQETNFVDVVPVVSPVVNPVVDPVVSPVVNPVVDPVVSPVHDPIVELPDASINNVLVPNDKSVELHNLVDAGLAAIDVDAICKVVDTSNEPEDVVNLNVSVENLVLMQKKDKSIAHLYERLNAENECDDCVDYSYCIKPIENVNVSKMCDKFKH